MITPVWRVLAGKRRGLVTASIEDSVYSAIARMDDHGVGAILVHDAGHLVGIFTERDYLRRIILMGRQSHTTRLGDAMTTAVLTVTEEATVQQCLHAMSHGRLRHLPVRRGRRIIGILSIGDCVMQLLADQRVELRALHDYVEGRYPA
jgi:CBS domain-containing protein